MHILLVDDEPKLVSLIKRGLQQASFAVDVSGDGASALEMTTVQAYDVIILDWMLPGLYDGAAVCRILRERHIETPVLMLTAKALPRHKVAGLNNGADDYLTKPFDFDELIARVRALSRRAPSVTPVILRRANITLDTTHYVVRRGEQEIYLTARELALLEYFMRHAGQVLSKEAIIAKVWPYDAIVISNNVEVYVRMLRRKLDQPHQPSIIQTIKGIGYKLV